MSSRDFLTKLNLSTKYTSSVANLEWDKLDMFMGGLRPDIANDVMIGDNLLKTFS